MLFSEEDAQRLLARERRTLRGAAGTALAAALGVVPVLLLFALLGGALPDRIYRNQHRLTNESP